LDGSFKIEFNAKPDPKLPAKDEPTFVFHVNVDVTDSAGETRSTDRAIRVGYTALEATLSADDWQTTDKPIEIKVWTKTLDDEPQVAEGSLKIYALQAPEKVQRSTLTGAQPVRFRGWVQPQGNNAPENDLSNPNNWAPGEVIAEKG